MNKKINVLDVMIDDFTAKEAMRKTVDYMQSEPTDIIGIITANNLMESSEIEGYKDNVEQFDMVIAGDVSVLEAAGVDEGSKLKEIETQLYLKMLLRYLSKHRKKVFLLVNNEMACSKIQDYLKSNYRSINIAGRIVVRENETADDMIINDINGSEPDCVIAILNSPMQEEFILKNRTLVDTRVWLALSDTIISVKKAKKNRFRLMDFITGRALKRENDKLKKASWKTVNEQVY
ncbi:MAG: WecB/TagA/CpsF family glycosyltransferase [Lachnospiraceae bacterium]